MYECSRAAAGRRFDGAPRGLTRQRYRCLIFTFIHTADWQIGKPFGGFDERLAGRLEEARLDAVDRIGELATARGASHVLVAGDVFDAPDLSERALRQVLTRMGHHHGVIWVLLPGNHDPAYPGGVWERLTRIGTGPHVVIADKPQPIMLGARAVVLPAPLTAKATAVDPTRWMDADGRHDGLLRIGLAHGSVQGFGSEGESAVPIDPGRVASARLDYLALGDWHGLKRIGPRCWYSGTPEPDNFANNPKGHALVVTLAAGAEPVVEPVVVGRYAWARIKARITGTADLDALSQQIAAQAPQQSRLLVRLELSGSLSVGDHAEFATWRQIIDSRLQYLAIDADELGLTAGLDDPRVRDLIGSDGELQAAAERLEVLARQQADGAHGDAAPHHRRVAQTALVRLLEMARAVSGEGA